MSTAASNLPAVVAWSGFAIAFVFGAVAQAVALSFGLGGREAAGRQMEYWLARLRKNDKD